MTDHSRLFREDRLGWQLKQEASDEQPLFSSALQARIMHALDQHRPVESANTVPSRGTRVASYLLPAGVAVAAALLVCAAFYLAVWPRGELIAVDVSSEPGSVSAIKLAAPVTDVVVDVVEVAGSASDDLVDTVVLTQWNYFDQHAGEIAGFLLDPLPFDMQPAGLEPHSSEKVIP